MKGCTQGTSLCVLRMELFLAGCCSWGVSWAVVGDWASPGMGEGIRLGACVVMQQWSLTKHRAVLLA